MSSDTGRRSPRVQVIVSCADAAGEELRTLQAGAVTYRIAFDPRAAWNVLTP